LRLDHNRRTRVVLRVNGFRAVTLRSGKTGFSIRRRFAFYLTLLLSEFQLVVAVIVHQIYLSLSPGPETTPTTRLFIHARRESTTTAYFRGFFLGVGRLKRATIYGRVTLFLEFLLKRNVASSAITRKERRRGTIHYPPALYGSAGFLFLFLRLSLFQLLFNFKMVPPL